MLVLQWWKQKKIKLQDFTNKNDITIFIMELGGDDDFKLFESPRVKFFKDP